MIVQINGKKHYVWRAVDHQGEVLERCVTKRCDKFAARAFLKKALTRHGRAETNLTDGLKSDPLAMRKLGNAARHEMGRWLNNRVENSHLRFRRRERHNHCNQERQLVDHQTFAPLIQLDQAIWHGSAELVVPPNITLMPSPPRCPESNPVENVWQFMRENWLSNRVFKSCDDVCFAWNRLVEIDAHWYQTIALGGERFAPV